MPDSNFSVSVTYDGVTNTVTNNTNIVLNTNHKMPSSNLEIVGNNVESLMLTYNGNSRVITDSFNTKTLNIKNKIMKDNIEIKIGPLEVNYVEFYSDAPFSIKSANSTASTASRRKGWEGTITYSYDTLTWSEWDAVNTDVVSSPNLIKGKYRLYMRGTNNTRLTGAASTSSTYCWQLTATTLVYCDGNIAHLLDYLNPPTTLTTTYTFNHLFDGWAYLASAPVLPFTSLTSRCYRYMFANCTSLTTSPALPATTLGIYCYQSMFSGCTNLNTLPALPSKSIVNNCYSQMFYNCKAIKIIAGTDSGYPNLYQIPSTGTATDLPSSSTKWSAEMFYGTYNTSPWNQHDPEEYLQNNQCNFHTSNTIIT